MRLDGLSVAQTSELRRFLPQMMTRRTDASLLFTLDVRFGPIESFLETQNEGAEHRLGLFHVVLAAMLRTLVERPQLNRTVIGGRLFERSTLALTFAVKKGKRDDARIVSTKVVFQPTDTLLDVQRRVDEAVANSRDPGVKTTSEREMAVLNRLPRPLLRRMLRGVQRLDRLGMLPSQLTADDPTHTSAFVSNLGSIGLDASFHHLSNAGTASLHSTVGRVKPTVLVSAEGQPEVADAFSIKLALDDRIVDGFYCAKSLQRLEHWLSHPAALLQPRPRRDDLVVGMLWTRALQTPEAPAYHLRSSTENGWFASSWRHLLEEVRAAGRALIELGVQPGDRVCIQGSNRPEWTVTYLGAQAIGAVPCGLHEDLVPAELQAALQVARPTAVLLETDGPVDQVRDVLPSAAVVSMLRETDAATTWTDFLELGTAHDDGEVERRLEAIRPSDPAVAVFTSGTTGAPRAALLTHANLAWTAHQAIEALGLGPGDTTVSYLPLSHVAEQNFTIVVALAAGGSVAYAPNRGGVVDTLREFRPSVFFAVPKIWDRLRGDLDPDLASIGLDRVRVAVSGAGALDPVLFDVFAGHGLPLLQTYGQTEGCGPTTLTRPGDARRGTCGSAFPGVDLKLSPHGEVLFRGPNVFAGYLDDPDATAAILRDGWVHSGDAGVCEDGHLRIVGRIKALLVTTGGDNIAPEPMEATLETLGLVDRAMVVGDGRPGVTALLTLDTEAAVAWLAAHGEGPVEAVHTHTGLRDAIERDVSALNHTWPRAAQIRDFSILPRALTPEDGELTPTLKLRRDVVRARWASWIDSMYAGGAHGAAPVPSPRTGFAAGPALAAELDALFALRFQVFSDAGHLAAGHWCDERMRDRFDDTALQFALRDTTGELAGTARLVPAKSMLPVESLFDFDALEVERAQVGEIGRLAIDPRWRARRAPVVTLIRAVLDEALLMGLSHVYAFVPARTIRSYSALGLPVWELPQRAPTEELQRARAAMAPYFEQQDPRVVVFTRPSAVPG